ncbi:MAG: T9SS type A sorting domain-containing protein [candidate division KSB1 bacterium]
MRARFVHAVTDAPTIDLVAANGNVLVSNLNYGAASQPINLAPGTYSVSLLRSSDKQNLGAHTLNVSSNANDYVVITLTGFLNPSANQNGPAAALGVYEVQFTPTAVEERGAFAPASFELEQNFPNPFNPVTSIQFSVGSEQFVSLKVYDVLGKEVATLVAESKPAGVYSVSFHAQHLPSGIYFYKLTAGEFAQVRKMALLR